MEVLNLIDYQELELQRERDRVDFRTFLAENIYGSCNTVFPLYHNGFDLESEDGRCMTAVNKMGQAEAKAQVRTNPDLWFVVRRTSIEGEETDEAIDMALGNGPNTMIIVSDRPPELEDVTDDIGGYDGKRRQAYLRVFARKYDGTFLMHSQSLDGSVRLALEAIFEEIGEDAEPGELLSQRKRKDFSDTEQDELVERLRGVYDNTLSEIHGGEFHAGIRPADTRNTYEFVCHPDQEDIVEMYVDLKESGQLTVDSMYDIAAEAKKRFKTNKESTSIELADYVVKLDVLTSPQQKYEQLKYEVELAGKEARARGENQNACGITLKANNEARPEGFEEGGYSYTSSDEDLDCIYPLEECPKCHQKDIVVTNTKSSIKGSCGCKVKKNRKK